MASVLFSTVGHAVGGPLGAAIGAVVGGSVDSVLFGPKGRNAGDIFVQRSAYGDVLPRIYGRTRTAGQLIWAMGMQDMSGKGRSRRNAGASFAIALSARPIRDVGRIWADGREIRSAAGEFETPTIMRVHKGGPGQALDPLIFSAEGGTGTPDYRGLAYVVFENMSLAPFGNRIPNLSFEILTGEEQPQQWLADFLVPASIAVDMTEAELKPTGYSAFGDGAEEALQLSRLTDLGLNFAEGTARFAARSELVDIGWDELLGGDEPEAELQQQVRPASFALTYLDPERDYQAGRQYVERGRQGMGVESEAPVCATASAALALAGSMLRKAEANSDQVRFALPWRWLRLSVGDCVTIGGRGPWRIIEREVRNFGLYCKAERLPDIIPRTAATGDPGRSLPQPVIPAGPTRIRIFEAPVPVIGRDPGLYVWLGGGPGWRGAEAEMLTGGGERYLGRVTEKQAHGTLIDALDIGPIEYWDQKNQILVAVETGLPVFESRTEEQVLAGANLILAGNELLQYADAEQISDNIVRLSGLLRGRFGTDRMMRPLWTGEVLYQINPDALLRLDVSADEIGRELIVMAAGAGDPLGGTEKTSGFAGHAIALFAPAHLQVGRAADGSIRSEWVPRSADHWSWGLHDSVQQSWVWKFVSNGRELARFLVLTNEFEISADTQTALSGSLFEQGFVMVEAVGPGPTEFRTTTFELN